MVIGSLSNISSFLLTVDPTNLRFPYHVAVDFEVPDKSMAVQNCTKISIGDDILIKQMAKIGLGKFFEKIIPISKCCLGLKLQSYFHRNFYLLYVKYWNIFPTMDGSGDINYYFWSCQINLYLLNLNNTGWRLYLDFPIKVPNRTLWKFALTG